MNWFYAKNNQQLGPISEAELQSLLQRGDITPETLIWKEGMAEWQPYQQVMATPAPAPTTVTPPPVVRTNGNQTQCPTCKDLVDKDYLIPAGSTQICPSCREDYVQRMKEGATASGAGAGNSRGTGGQTPNAELMGIARNTLSGKWTQSVIFTFLYLLLTIGMNFIPYIGNLIKTICHGPFRLGATQFWLNTSRDIPAQNDMLFAGFKLFGKAFGANFMIGLYISLGILLAAIPGFIVIGIALAGNSGDPVMAFTKPLGIVGIIVTIIPVIIVGTIIYLQYALTFFIIADDPDFGVFDALRTSKTMMMGFKKKLWYLNLRFVGWSILTIFTAYIGVLWLIPYYQTSIANFYDDLGTNDPQV